MQEEQGCYVRCVYCSEIKPDVGKECPFCQGKNGYFKQAQMMDGVTSRKSVLNEFIWSTDVFQNYNKNSNPETAKRLRDKLVSIVEKINLYQFDLKQALIECIYDLEAEMSD